MSAANARSVLLVDDNPSALDFLLARLRSLGFRTTVATNGELALEQIRREKPAIVVLDVTMPELNGYQTCREIKTIDRALPVIILTAKNDPADRFWARQAGADAFLVKPIDPALVVDRIRALLGEP